MTKAKNKNYGLPIRPENTEKFIGLAIRIIVMENDSYLSGHPEWHEFVKEARQALKSENIIF